MPENSPTGGPPAADPPEPVARGRRKNVVCGYCDCELDQDGERMKMSPRYKKLLAQEENDNTRIERIAALESQVSDLQKKLAATVPGVEAVTVPTTRKS